MKLMYKIQPNDNVMSVKKIHYKKVVIIVDITPARNVLIFLMSLDLRWGIILILRDMLVLRTRINQLIGSAQILEHKQDSCYLNIRKKDVGIIKKETM